MFTFFFNICYTIITFKIVLIVRTNSLYLWIKFLSFFYINYFFLDLNFCVSELVWYEIDKIYNVGLQRYRS